MPAPRRRNERGSLPWATHRELPPLNIPEWMEGARCRETDPEVFFPPQGTSAKTAKKICMSCEERVTCLDWALETGQDEFGVLGGKTPPQRRKLKREALTAAAAQEAAPMEATA